MFKYGYDLENVKLYCCFKNCFFVSTLYCIVLLYEHVAGRLVCGEIEEHCALPVGGLLNYQRLVTSAEQFDYYWSRLS